MEKAKGVHCSVRLLHGDLMQVCRSERFCMKFVPGENTSTEVAMKKSEIIKKEGDEQHEFNLLYLS